MIVPGGHLGQAGVADLGHAAPVAALGAITRARRDVVAEVGGHHRGVRDLGQRLARAHRDVGVQRVDAARRRRSSGPARARSTSPAASSARRRARSAGAAAARRRRRTPPRAAPRARAPTGSGCGRAARPCPAAARHSLRDRRRTRAARCTAAMPASRPPSSIVSNAPRRTTMYMRRGSMAIVVRRACLRQRQLRPHPARGAGGDRRRQPRPRRLLRRRRVDRAAADRRPARTSARTPSCSRCSTARARTSSACARCCGRGRASICAESAHLNVDECGAPEALGGIKLLTVPTPDGKLTPELVEHADRADRRRARRPARRRLGHAVDRARHAVLGRRAAGARRPSRTRTGCCSTSTARGWRTPPPSLDVLAARDHGRDRRGRRAASAARRSGCWPARRSWCCGRSSSSRCRTCASSRCSWRRRCAIVSRAAARAARGRPVAADSGPRERDGDAAGRRRARRDHDHAGGAANAVFAILPPGAAERAPARLQVLRLERAHRRGALDVLVGHHRGGRRRVRRGDPRGRPVAGHEHRGL